MAMIRPVAAPVPGRRLQMAAGLALAASALILVGAWNWNRLNRGSEPAAPLPRELAEVISRHIDTVFADAQDTWRRSFRLRLGRSYAAPELVLFSRATPTPCAGARAATGPFYCRRTRTAAFDLAFFESLARQLREKAEFSATLLVGRIAAEHVQDEIDPPSAVGRDLDAVLRGDCLAGLWAAAAVERIGVVPEGLYGRAIEGARRATDSIAVPGRNAAVSLNGFDLGRPAARDAAFRAGYAGLSFADCPVPGAG